MGNGERETFVELFAAFRNLAQFPNFPNFPNFPLHTSLHYILMPQSLWANLPSKEAREEGSRPMFFSPIPNSQFPIPNSPNNF